ncbi:MAG: lipid II flippase MurJ, partial [Candidatus Paceibacterota bacterium]
GQFSGEAVSVTSACLGIFALSLIFQCLEPTILRAFFSIKDSKTPAIISIIFLFINLTLSLGFVYLLQVNENLNAMLLSLFNLNNPEHALLLGLVLAYNISLVIDFVLLFVFLRKKIEDFEVKKIQGFLVKIFFSSVIMTVIALFIMSLFNNFNGFWMNLLEFIAVTIISFIIYFILTYILKTEEARNLGQFLGIPLTKL